MSGVLLVLGVFAASYWLAIADILILPLIDPILTWAEVASLHIAEVNTARWETP